MEGEDGERSDGLESVGGRKREREREERNNIKLKNQKQGEAAEKKRSRRKTMKSEETMDPSKPDSTS